MAKNLFRNKIVVISNGCSSLGQSLALNLAKQRADVIIIGQDRDSLNKVVEDAAQLKKAGKIIPVIGQLNSKESCEAVMNTIKRAAGSFDILINNVSYFKSGKFDDFNIKEIQELINSNIYGLILFTQMSLPYLKNNKKPGVINICDHMGKIAFPFLSVYSATRFAMVGFTQALQRELANERIRVMAVYTAGIKNNINEETENKLQKLGFSFDEPDLIAQKIMETYNLEKDELVFGKKEKSLVLWNTISKNSVDNKFKKIRTKILNAISAAQ